MWLHPKMRGNVNLLWGKMDVCCHRMGMSMVRDDGVVPLQDVTAIQESGSNLDQGTMTLWESARRVVSMDLSTSEGLEDLESPSWEKS